MAESPPCRRMYAPEDSAARHSAGRLCVRHRPWPDHLESHSGANREARAGGRDQGRRAAARHARPASRGPGRQRRQAGRGSASCAIFPTAVASPTIRAASCTSWTRTTSRRCTSMSARVSTRCLQPARKRLHRLRLPSRVRAERLVLHGAYRTRPGQSGKRPTSSRLASQQPTLTYHNVITEWHADESGREHVQGHAARVAARRRTSSRTSRIRWARSSSIRPRSPATPTTACCTRAAAITGSATAAGRTPAIPAQTQRLDSIITAILRIDPRSPSVTHGTKGLGDYTIPMANKFAADGDPKTLGEIYAYGFRNAHRLSWDPPTGRCSPPTSA